MLRALTRYYTRMALYRGPTSHLFGRLLLNPRANSRTPATWDAMMSGSFAPYLGKTVSIAARDSIVCALLRQARSPSSILDLGCGAGSLAQAISGCGVAQYLGSDISRIAIETATQRRNEHPSAYPDECAFSVGDLREFSPPDGACFDAICFNEVLYYLGDPQSAADQVARYTRWLSPDGLLCISMKDDAKSHAIFSRLTSRFRWVTGALFQEKAAGPGFRITINQERPAYLIAVLRLPPPSTTDGGGRVSLKGSKDTSP